MSTDIETAFHTSLDRLLRGEAKLDACLAEYPEHHERLRDMLVVALDLQALTPVPLDQPAVERGARLIDDELQRLRARLDRQPEPATAWERLTWWLPRFMPVRMAGLAAAFAIALIAYGGVTLAAVNSGPDSALYGYRLTLEELRIGFASDEEKAYLYLDTAEQRLREIESAAGVGDAGAVARASTAYQEVVRKGVDVLDAVARDVAPGAERTGEVAADYRRRLAEHDTRFDSLTTKTSEAQRAPITRARSLVQAGLQDVHSGPILAAAPTAAPDPSPAPTAAAPAPASSPSPTPAVGSTPPLSPAPPTPTPQGQAATPAPTATATPVPAIDITGSTVVVTGQLMAVTDVALVVAGISIGRGDLAAVHNAPLAARVRAEALIDADGRHTLVGLEVVQSAGAPTEVKADDPPPAAPDPTPSPDAPPADGTPPPATEPQPEATATPAPAVATPAAEPTASDSAPGADTSPTPSAPDGGPPPTPEVAPPAEPSPGQSTPSPPEPTEAPSDAAPTPTGGDGTPSPVPEATPGSEAIPAERAPTPSDEAPPEAPTPAPSPAEGAPTPTEPPAAATPAPTPGSTEPPTPSDEAPPAPEPDATPTPGEGEPSPPPGPTPVETPAPTEGEAPPPPEAATPTPSPAEGAPTPTEPPPAAAPAPPTLQGVLTAIDAFSVRAGGIVFSRPLDTPLVLHGPMAPGDVVLVTFEALRTASAYVLVAREVAPIHPSDGAVATRWQGFVSAVGAEGLTVNGVHVHVAAAAREADVWTSMAVGALVELALNDPGAGEPVANAVRLLETGAAQSFNSLAQLPQG